MRERESARERESTANKDFKLPGTKVLVRWYLVRVQQRFLDSTFSTLTQPRRETETESVQDDCNLKRLQKLWENRKTCAVL